MVTMDNKTYCEKCGTAIEEGQQFCGECGWKVGQGDETISPFFDEYKIDDKRTTSPTTTTYPLKWFKFLIYFALFFGAFYNFVMGMNYIMGTIYFTQTNGQVTAEMVYGMYGSSLKILDIVYGIVLLGTAALGIVCRFKLAKYKKEGPRFVYLLYAIALASSVIYTIGVSIISKAPGTINASFVSGIVVQAIYLYANYKYFTKRSELFIN